MKINCNIAADLLPLYVEDSCSADSKALLEEHLSNCPACRDKLKRMEHFLQPVQKVENVPLNQYAQKVKQHRRRSAVLWTLAAVLSVLLLTLLTLTLMDMNHQANLKLITVEEGTTNLMAAPLEVLAEDTVNYTLFTNSTNIVVSIQSADDLEGEIILWDAQQNVDIGIHAVHDNTPITFSNLTSATRYRIVCEGLDGAIVNISDGHNVTFMNSLASVLWELMELLP